MLDRSRVLPHMLAGLAAATPDRDFYVDIVEGRALTCAELHREFLVWADGFRAIGVAPGENVVTMLPNNYVATEAWLGLSWLPAVEVPLNVAYRGPMLEYIINNCDARVAVFAARFLDRLVEVAPALEHLETVVVPDAEESLPDLPLRVLSGAQLLEGRQPAVDLAGPEYYDICCMIYTSGTTGPSKGVLVPWGELYQFGGSSPENLLAQGDGYYMSLPQFHVGGKSGVYIAAQFNARLIVRETFSPTAFWDDIRTHRVTAAGLVGPMASLLMSLPPKPDDADSPLQRCTMGPLVPNVEEFKKRFGVEVSTGYGMTEIAAPLASDGFNLVDNTSCGKVRTGYPGYEVRVVNEFDEPLGPGDVGELIVRTDAPWALNAGYYGMPEVTARAWRNGWFHTGDGFRYDEDGNFYFVDRMKDAIRRRGENISSFEVEAYVLRHPPVAEAAAVAVPSEHGEDEVKVVVVPREGEEFSPEGLIEFLIPIMPRFMVPRYVEVAQALPRTQTMRIQKMKLRDVPIGDDTWDREAAGIEIPK